jgi:ribosome-associated translation inhibitor RaiA
MNYQITSDNIAISPSMETLTKDKFERIESRYKDYPADSCFARVVLNTAPDNMFYVKVDLNINGKEYFSDETEYSLEAGLIKVVEELLEMIEKDSIVQRRKELKEEETLEKTLAEEI